MQTRTDWIIRGSIIYVGDAETIQREKAAAKRVYLVAVNSKAVVANKSIQASPILGDFQRDLPILPDAFKYSKSGSLERDALNLANMPRELTRGVFRDSRGRLVLLGPPLPFALKTASGEYVFNASYYQRTVKPLDRERLLDIPPLPEAILAHSPGAAGATRREPAD